MISMKTKARVTLASAALVLASAAGASETTKDDDANDAYVVVMTDDDRSAQELFARYPELSGSWEELAKFNLLRAGHVVENPSGMLSSDGVLAKVANLYGEAEVKRTFDNRFIPLVPTSCCEKATRSGRGAAPACASSSRTATTSS